MPDFPVSPPCLALNPIVEAEKASTGSLATIKAFLKDRVIELGSSQADVALQWASSLLLMALTINRREDVSLGEIRDLIQEVLAKQGEIVDRLQGVLSEIQFQHLVTRGFEAIERILDTSDRLVSLALISDSGERDREAALLRTAILDPNLGAMLNLRTIHDILMGSDPLGQGQALITLFADRWFDRYTPRQLNPDTPLSTYTDTLDAWLNALALTQYLALSALANARLAQGDHDLLKIETQQTIDRLTAQAALMEQSIPPWTRTMPKTLFDGGWWVFRGLDPAGARIDASQVLYGSPSAQFIPLNYTVQFRDRHNHNGDEEWMLEPAGNTDTFCLRVRARNYRVVREGDRIMCKDGATPLRLVMGRTKASAVPADAKRAQLYEPVIGMVGQGAYLAWTRGGQNLVRPGDLNAAVRVRIERA
jgi:hypothetical protein